MRIEAGRLAGTADAALPQLERLLDPAAVEAVAGTPMDIFGGGSRVSLARTLELLAGIAGRPLDVRVIEQVRAVRTALVSAAELRSIATPDPRVRLFATGRARIHANESGGPGQDGQRRI